MGYDRDEYYQECFEAALCDEGLGRILDQMSKEQRANIGGAIAGAVENEGMAFHRPQSPLVAENERLKRRLKWERELVPCAPCNGSGRLKYAAGPWAINSSCDHCHGDGRVHPHGDTKPSF